MNYIIDDEKDLVRIDKFLIDKLSISRSKVQEMIKQNLVLINGKNTKNSYVLKLNDKIVSVSNKNTKILVSINDISVYICYDNNIDKEEVLKELTKKKETLEASIKRRNNLLSNENYVKKAPSNIVEKERLDLQKETDMLNNVLKEIESLG